MPKILLTNDDGYRAEGLRAMAEALRDFATVSIVAPHREQSGTAQSLTLRRTIVSVSVSTVILVVLTDISDPFN
jgi:5'-nucleotidase